MKNFDVLIIGSGMGGLVAGNILSREGYMVCVIEKNKQIGGCLQIYVRDKVIFDSGVHYLGGLDKGQNLCQIFRWLGLMDKLRLEKMDPAFDYILLGSDDKEYRIMQGYESFGKQMVLDFPEEEKAIQIYISTIQNICDRFPFYRLRVEDAGEKQEVMGLSAKKFIESITKNEKLRAVLAGNNMLYAGSGDKTPFYVHALTVNSYIESSWRCLDGGVQIAKILAENIKEAGGEIIRNRQVKKLIVEDGHVVNAVLSDGTAIYAKHFISNTTPKNTYRMLDSSLIRPASRSRVENMDTTISSFILNIVFKKDHFPYIKHNYYYHQAGKVWEMDQYNEENWPLGYAIYISPSVSKQDYAGGMTIFAYMRYDEMSAWELSFNTISSKQSRGAGYDAFKKRKAEKLLDRVEEKFPGIRESILHYYTSTPLTYRDYIGNEDGNLYGPIKDFQDPLRTLFSPKTRIPNVYLTGQWLNLHGILGTAISGMITAAALMGKNDFIEKIKNA